jgi:hypothetical protein
MVKIRQQICCLKIRIEKPTSLEVDSRITLNKMSKVFCRSNVQRPGRDSTFHCRVGRKAGSCKHTVEPLASLKTWESIFTNTMNCRTALEPRKTFAVNHVTKPQINLSYHLRWTFWFCDQIINLVGLHTGITESLPYRRSQAIQLIWILFHESSTALLIITLPCFRWRTFWW